jgi:hypothetical protein
MKIVVRPGVNRTSMRQRNIRSETDSPGTKRNCSLSSKQIERVSDLYRKWGPALASNPNITLDEWRDLIEGWEVLTTEPGRVDNIETDAGGVPALWAIPKSSAKDRVILVIHVGRFCDGIDVPIAISLPMSPRRAPPSPSRG